MPAVSILVPCFDDGPYIDAALASLAAQSAGDFEAVISDDGSRDDSPAIAEAWAARDRRFRLLRHAENAGMTENWNRALAAARGELVAKLDADDLWQPATLDTLRVAFDRTPGAVAAFCRAEIVDAALAPLAPWPGDAALERSGLDPECAWSERGKRLWRLSLGDVQLWHSNAFLVRREDLVRIGGFDERWGCAADTALLLRLFAEDRLVTHAPYVGVIYRRRAGSVSDDFERRGWKALEGLLVRLDALERDAARLGPLPRAAREAWWQAWLGVERMRRDAGLWRDMPPARRRRLEAAIAAARRPPLAIRVEGRLRLSAWLARRSFARRLAEGAGG